MKKFFLLIAMAAFFATSNVNAGIYNVSNAEELRNAINSVSDGDTIKIVQSIKIPSLYFLSNAPVTKSITITAETDREGEPIFMIDGSYNREQYFRTFVFSKNSNSVIENLIIYGSVEDGIKVIDNASITVNNVIALGCVGYGIYFESSGNYNINNFFSLWCGGGIYIRSIIHSNANTNYIRNSEIHYSGQGIIIHGTNVEINNIVFANSGIPLRTLPAFYEYTFEGANAMITNITVSNCSGIRIGELSNVCISNAILNGGGIGISGNCILHNSVISGNGISVSGNVLISNCTISESYCGISVSKGSTFPNSTLGDVSIINTTVVNNTYGLSIYNSSVDWIPAAKALVSNSIFYDNTEADFADIDSSYRNQSNLNIFNSVYKTWQGSQPSKIENCSQENPLLVAKYKENENLIEYYLPQSGSSAINLADSRFASEDFLTKFDGEHFLDLPNNFNRANYFDSLLNYDQIGSKRKIENGRYTAGSIDYNASGISANFVTAMDIEVFPNPTSGKIHLQFSLLDADILEISLFDILGRKLRTFYSNLFFGSGEHCLDLDLSGIASGHYYLNLTNSKNNLIQPIPIKIQP